MVDATWPVGLELREIAPRRISRNELAVPPEFQDLGRTGHEASRVGGARIELIASPEGTRLGACYQQIPVRLMPPFDFDGEAAALLYLINLTAGLLDGDGHLIQLVARAGTRSVVTGQSATRVHPAVKSHATQQWVASVEDDACLVVLPGPTIPYRGARLYQRGRADLAKSGRLLWGDIWLAGRYARLEKSERFVFERIVQDLEVRRDGELIYRDRFRWDGPWDQSQIDWHFGGELASGSLFIGGPVGENLPELSPGLKRAIFRLDTGDSCVRWCGHPADVTRDLVMTAMSIAGEWTGGPGAAPWLIGSNGLAPNHWFSVPAKSLSEPDKVL